MRGVSIHFRVNRIELLPSICEIARIWCDKFEEWIKQGTYKHTGYTIPLANVELRQGSFLDLDFSDADIIYLPCTTFTVQFMKDISRRCAKLKPGTKIITLSKPLPCITEKDCNVVYNVYDKRSWLMTWGLEPVYYQIKQ